MFSCVRCAPKAVPSRVVQSRTLSCSCITIKNADDNGTRTDDVTSTSYDSQLTISFAGVCRCHPTSEFPSSSRGEYRPPKRMAALNSARPGARVVVQIDALLRLPTRACAAASSLSCICRSAVAKAKTTSATTTQRSRLIDSPLFL